MYMIFVSCNSHARLSSPMQLRTHTFENWELKLNKITIGDFCTVGHSSTLMANSMTHDYAEVGANTFVMKNEVLAEGTYYCGLPAEPAGKSRVARQARNGLPVKQNVSHLNLGDADSRSATEIGEWIL